jgi:transposase
MPPSAPVENDRFVQSESRRVPGRLSSARHANYHDRFGSCQERVSGSRDRRGRKRRRSQATPAQPGYGILQGAAAVPCMEACATAHYWARELTKLGRQVRLMRAKDVKAHVKRNKNDAADAEAICEAVRRLTMRFVGVKSAEQQGQLMQHRTRDLLMRQRTQLINALRANLAELGIAAAQGREGIKGAAGDRRGRWGCALAR